MNHQYSSYPHHGGEPNYSGFLTPQTTTSHFPQQHNGGGWKRPRSSPTSEEEGCSWQSSFKRMKVMDDSDNTLITTTSFGTLKRSLPRDAVAPLRDEYALPQNQMQTHYQAFPKAYPPPHQHQTSSQQSSELPSPAPPADPANYHTTNSLLGSLHLMRRRQRTGDTAAHQPPHSMQHHHSHLQHHHQHQAQTAQYHPPSPRRHSRKKVVSLRVDSKLY